MVREGTEERSPVGLNRDFCQSKTASQLAASSSALSPHPMSSRVLGKPLRRRRGQAAKWQGEWGSFSFGFAKLGSSPSAGGTCAVATGSWMGYQGGDHPMTTSGYSQH